MVDIRSNGGEIKLMQKVDVIIIGAGAAGLMCAIEAGKRKRSVIVLEGSNKPGKKILMSGGGRCNFTNYYIEPKNYISHNPHFCKSALSRYTQWDFIELVKRHQIPFHEKTLGQLFCDSKSQAILTMLLTECERYGVDLRINSANAKIEKIDDYHFKVTVNDNSIHCQSLVIASGGLSIPNNGCKSLWLSDCQTIWYQCMAHARGSCAFHLAGK
jgi:predicted Rossmann fold flavoprotein